MPGIFVNYRRGDHVDLLAGVVDQLARHFGAEQVFLDERSIDAGHYYPDVLRKRLIDSEVVIAVVHDGWFTDRDEAGRCKLDREDDWVRQELLLALEHDRPVVPVLVGEVRLPSPAELATMESWIQRIFSAQAARVRPRTRPVDVARLIEVLEKDVAPLWRPAEARDIEPIRLSPRWLYVILPPVLLAFLAGPAVLVRDDPAAVGDEPPPLMPLAILFTLMSIAAALVLLLVGHGLGRLLNAWDSEFQRAPTRDYHLTSQPMVAVLILFVGGGALYSDMSVAGWAFVLVCLLFAASYGGVLAVRGRRLDQELDANWPHRIPMPMHPSHVRRAMVRSAKRLTGEWSQPLSRIQRDQGGWMLERLGEARDQLRRQAAMSRREWVFRRHPWYSSGYLAWNTLIVGLVLASAVPQIRTGTDPLSLWALVSAVTVAVLGATTTLTLEICYRSHRRRIQRVAKEVGDELQRLETRWLELCTPLSWQLVDLPPRAPVD